MEGAKIYAQNAIRKKQEALNYMKLASRLDAVVSRLDTQAKMQAVGKVRGDELSVIRLSECRGSLFILHPVLWPSWILQNMSAIVKNLEKSINDNNLEKIVETMSGFEKQFEVRAMGVHLGAIA